MLKDADELANESELPAIIVVLLAGLKEGYMKGFLMTGFGAATKPPRNGIAVALLGPG